MTLAVTWTTRQTVVVNSSLAVAGTVDMATLLLLLVLLAMALVSTISLHHLIVFKFVDVCCYCYGAAL
jgi:hypothetical protein